MLLVAIFICTIGAAIVLAFFRVWRFIGGRSGKGSAPYRDPEVLEAERKKILTDAEARRKEREDARRKALDDNPFR
jgi:hypothetical protein